MLKISIKGLNYVYFYITIVVWLHITGDKMRKTNTGNIERENGNVYLDIQSEVESFRDPYFFSPIQPSNRPHKNPNVPCRTQEINWNGEPAVIAYTLDLDRDVADGFGTHYGVRFNGVLLPKQKSSLLEKLSGKVSKDLVRQNLYDKDVNLFEDVARRGSGVYLHQSVPREEADSVISSYIQGITQGGKG